MVRDVVGVVVGWGDMVGWAGLLGSYKGHLNTDLPLSSSMRGGSVMWQV